MTTNTNAEHHYDLFSKPEIYKYNLVINQDRGKVRVAYVFTAA